MIGLIGFAGIYAAGRFLVLPRWLSWFLAGLWWVAVLAITFVARQRGLSQAVVGGDFVGWVTFGFLVAVLVLVQV